jgi:hypothetical protein
MTNVMIGIQQPESKGPTAEARLQRECMMHSPRPSYRHLTTSIASFWQAWHSKVRCSEPGSSGSIRVSHIGAPHLAHVGRTMSCEGID